MIINVQPQKTFLFVAFLTFTFYIHAFSPSRSNSNIVSTSSIIPIFHVVEWFLIGVRPRSCPHIVERHYSFCVGIIKRNWLRIIGTNCKPIELWSNSPSFEPASETNGTSEFAIIRSSTFLPILSWKKQFHWVDLKVNYTILRQPVLPSNQSLINIKQIIKQYVKQNTCVVLWYVVLLLISFVCKFNRHPIPDRIWSCKKRISSVPMTWSPRRLSKYSESFVTYRIVDFLEFVLTLLNSGVFLYCFGRVLLYFHFISFILG